MTTQDFRRKLTAILSADVKGYSRLMGKDEVATIRTLTAYREMMAALIRQQRGRVVDSPGDNLLAEFSSVVDAVRCAVEIQEELEARNADLPENRKMEFRIGINLGDVVEEGDRIYGDGVNVAARLESLAEEGGICISGTAFDQVEDKLALGYEYLGEQVLKNIAKPVRVYRLLMDPEAAGKVIGEERAISRRWHRAALAVIAVLAAGAVALAIRSFYLHPASPPEEVVDKNTPGLELPGKPSIAVLPFGNMSDDPQQEYFSDGITEEIITGLSKVPHMFVIARNSTYIYKGKPVKTQQVSRELGVRYVLEGSVRKAGDRVRISAQLIDATTGHHLWAERYDRNLKDIFAIQDEITKNIITALQVELREGEEARVYGRGTGNLDAYLKLLQGREHSNRFNREGNILARQMYEEAIVLDPEYAVAYLRLSATHLMDLIYGSSKSPQRSLVQAEELIKKALALDESLAEAYSFLGRIYLTKRQYAKAVSEGERAIALAPNSAFAHAALAFTLHFAGRPEESLGLYKKAIRLNPIPRSWYLTGLASSYRMMGQYREAIALFKKVLRSNPDHLLAHMGLASAYSLLGREEEARAEAEEVLRIDPKFSLDHLSSSLLYKNRLDTELVLDSLRKAGLK
jgi:adenylate cyclase